jgi:hypothetical protein
VTPEQAAGFYEEDEDPAEVFAWFDATPPDGVTTEFRAGAAEFMDRNDELLRRLAGS